MKEQEILDGDWHNLIVLDACRYDIFEEVCDIKGNLEKRLSRGSCTVEWLYRTFYKPLDVVFFSANPFINSQGMNLGELAKCARKNYPHVNWEWNALDIFTDVVDVWKWGWNNKHSTVLPDTLTDSVIDTDYNGRKIIHYIQPHQPYIIYDGGKKKWGARDKLVKGGEDDGLDIKEYIKSIVKRAVKDKKKQWTIKKILGGKLNTFQYLVVHDKLEELIELYEQNLRVVLDSVKRLIDNIEGKTLITSDHGEAFGEQDDWGHKYNSNNPILRQVPWFEVER